MKPVLYLILLPLFAGPVFTESNFSHLKVLYNTIEKCSEEKDVGVCLKLKAVGLMDRALVQDEPLPLTNYISIAKDPSKGVSQNSYNETESEIAARLPRSYEERSSTLDQMLQDRISKYLETRTIQLNIPTDVLEGRKKKDKGGYMMMGMVATASMLLQLAMGKIALLAGKALLIGKIALLLSAVIGLKKLVGSGGGGGGGDSHPQVIYAHSNDHSGWGRSLSTPSTNEEESQKLAYRAHSK
ncbi:uncharacterized protein LOC142317808 [Lycorma delicatula]|uniref:uncharacterized protein LOC142317808 n=1 Tax=Lycorma delicatula TaxID=130591 RepID=UPI003F513796